MVFGCFVCACCDGGEFLSLSLSLFSFAKNMYAHVYVFLAKKKGKMIEEKELIKEILERREAQRTLPMNKQVYILLSLPTQKPGI